LDGTLARVRFAERPRYGYYLDHVVDAYATAAIGIRGTGIYVELDGARTYVCTCYGEAELTPLDDPAAAETVRTRHHDEPRYIYPRGMPRMIEKAPVINHTDAELVLLESLVGRKVPFDPAKYR